MPSIIKNQQTCVDPTKILGHFDFEEYRGFYQTNLHPISFSEMGPMGLVFSFRIPYSNQLL